MKISCPVTLLMVTFCLMLVACDKRKPVALSNKISITNEVKPKQVTEDTDTSNILKIKIPEGYIVIKDIKTNIDEDIEDERIILFNTMIERLCRDSLSTCTSLELKIYEQDNEQWVETFSQRDGFLWPQTIATENNNGFRDMFVYQKKLEIKHSEGVWENRTFYNNKYSYVGGSCKLENSQVTLYSSLEGEKGNLVIDYNLDIQDSTILIEKKHQNDANKELIKKSYVGNKDIGSDVFFNLLELQDSIVVLPRDRKLFDILLHLPDESSMISKEETLRIITRSQSEDNTIRPSQDIFYAIKEFDHVNKYLDIHGAFDGTWTMRCWEQKEGLEIIAVLQTSCSPLCIVDYLRFYEYDGLKMKEVQRPQITQIYYTDFFNLSPQEFENIRENNDTQISILFELPKKSKNIHAYLNNQFDGKGSDYELYLKEYQKGQRIPFIYNNNGNFTKGKIY